MRLRQTEGPLTAELARQPGGVGLGQVPVRLAPDATASMVCGFCSTGCSLDVHLRGGVPVNLAPTRSYPVNQGRACPKGWEALTPLRADDRATTPLYQGRALKWDQALDVFVRTFKAILAEHGPESVAFLSTGQIPTEEMALLGAVAKFGMGLVHGDGNTRQCMATSVVAYKEAFGFDAPPYTYADFEHSDVIVLVGSNLCIAHPILWQRICQNPHSPTIVVIDPRRTETAAAASWHLAVEPTGDLALLYGVAAALVRHGWVDRSFVDAHTSGFDEFCRFLEGVDVSADAERLASVIHQGERVSFWWTMGVNQSHQGVRTAQAIINLALMTGNVGRPGTGANSITGQCNAMGSRLFSNTTSLFAGRSFESAADRAEVAGHLGIDVERIPDRPSLAYDQLVNRVADGRIKGLWVIATNPAHSWIEQGALHDALGRLDFLCVQDMYETTETARRADLLLPAAGWGEKDGTFINSERRVGVIKRVADPPGQALPDFEIFRRIAEAWGCGPMFSRWSSPAAAFEIVQRLSAGRRCDITGIEDYAALEAAGGVQWPYPAGSPALAPRAERRLFEDGRFFHPDGRARFVFDPPRPPVEAPSPRYPLALLTGRGSSAQWHTLTRTGKSALLRSLAPEEPYVEVAPADAAARSVKDGDWVTVRSAQGAMRARARVTTAVSPGQVFVAMHWPEANQLTRSSFDPHSRQPAYKSGAVEIDRA